MQSVRERVTCRDEMARKNSEMIVGFGVLTVIAGGAGLAWPWASGIGVVLVVSLAQTVGSGALTLVNGNPLEILDLVADPGRNFERIMRKQRPNISLSLRGGGKP